MLRQISTSSRVTTRLINTRSLLIRRSVVPLASRSYFSSNSHGYYYEEPQPSKKVCFLLGATAALGAIYFVKPNIPKPKKKVPEEKLEPPKEKIISIEPPMSEELLHEPEETAQLEDESTTEVTILNGQIIGNQQNNTTSTKPKTSDKTNSAIDKETTKLGDLEEETKRESAYNPDTGEINWDCPCLGGMAHGPCGEEFKEAFSCFIYSEAEPKGIDCVEKFQGMQTCFRKYPEYYAEQLKDEEDAETVMQSEDFAQTNDNDESPVVAVSEETITIEEPEVVDTVEITSDSLTEPEPVDLVEEIELTESD
ncbi:Oxidoreductase [Maudiozyma exigua]|uniref:Mitochondrial intermembrane space import and assembly protein 40 n=1 Tax=Maudiozyma exigua TaxID=34358 RepID=A0A9P6VUC4_MAUEX|nr:Oxidoreductase [Kazachstania exigua]